MKELVIRDSILAHAPIELCFELSTRIDLVQETLGFTPDPPTGNISANSRVHWRGRMFGITHEHHTLITAFHPPHFFQDSQEQGRFALFHHDHHFRKENGGTRMEDSVYFALPWWLGGTLSARFIMAPVIRRLLRQRMLLLKDVPETNIEPHAT